MLEAGKAADLEDLITTRDRKHEGSSMLPLSAKKGTRFDILAALR